MRDRHGGARPLARLALCALVLAGCTTRPFLALAQLRRSEDAAAREHLEAFASLEPRPRLAAPARRAVGVLDLGPPPDAVRRFPYGWYPCRAPVHAP